MDLRLAFLLYVALPLLLLIGTVGSVSVGALEELSEKRLKEDLELIGRTLQKPLGRAMERGREGTLENALESAFSFGRVYGAYLYDESGERVAAAGAAAYAKEPDREDIAERAEAGQEGGTYGEMGGREVYSYFVPLTDGSGRNNGLVQITRRASEIQGYLQQLRGYGLAGLAGLAVILMLVTLLGHHFAVGRPLTRLAQSMNRVAAGDRDHRSSETGPREIADLSRTFNGMLRRMQQDQAEIRERRISEERLQRELQQSEKMAAVGRLSAGVAHELGTPLSVVDGTAQRLLRDERLDAGQRKRLERIRDQAGRMTQIVEQLLAFGRQPGGAPRPISTEQLTRAAIHSVRDLYAETGVELEWHTPQPPPMVEIDPVRGEQALTHLLTNAAQATPGGRVGLRWEIQGDEAVLTVEDDGPGIPLERREWVFDPFSTTKPPGQGSGLGLALVHGVAEEHGGTIHIEHSPLGGAAFVLRLPRAHPSAEPETGENDG
ncbi:hypothetical protein AN478_13125 [Thiohalorhabdus denitrificans]|uniref:histidine kinase n=1 Tax=Thiohalorhabdus denitrificans TaxID=381306 RepID=A0A0P9CJX8_9GAMM|nr:HAMP domain-containing sensor histidine kinase [Thiohalorhabdus denitrificans]KPV39210.1 hypothetical protein AN478_13125 [Thiohalorhabdus denitrificans]SCX75290.1 HAMP domain-containing protein [Thiohalorhabdus denitrificans]